MKKIIYNSGIILSVLFTLAILTASCGQEVAAPGQAATDTTAPASQSSNTNVARIVFVDQKQACDCTRKRIDGSWAALQAALGAHKDIPVERIHMDTDQSRVEPYEEMRAIMVLPAIYLLDVSGKLLDMVQGEVTTDNFDRILQ